MMKKTLLLSAILAVCLGACEYQECDVTPDPETGREGYFGKRLDCSGTMCTANFVMIDVEVKSASGAATRLDSFVVTDKSGRALPPSASGLPVFGASDLAGRYTVLNDAWVAGHEGLGGHFYAKGFQRGVMVFNEEYKISADCCHLSKVSGKDQIIVP